MSCHVTSRHVTLYFIYIFFYIYFFFFFYDLKMGKRGENWERMEEGEKDRRIEIEGRELNR